MIRALVALPFGLAVGSFMTVAVHRLPKGESVLSPRSRCPSCGVELRNRDNVPVVSWLLLRGKCHHCGAPISVEYPLTELATAVLVVGAAIVYESVWVIVAVGALLSMMPAISLIDIRHHIIPNKLMYPLPDRVPRLPGGGAPVRRARGPDPGRRSGSWPSGAGSSWSR